MERRETRVSGAEAALPRRSALRYVPNLLSASRLPIAAAFFVVEEARWRGALLLIGALTDALDGLTARHFRLQSRAGTIIDPLFDKLFVLVVLAAFLTGPRLGWAEFLLLIARDVYIALAYVVVKVLGFRVVWAPRLAGKLVTFLQVITLFVLLVVPQALGALVVAVAVASAVAIVDYTWAGVAALRRQREPGSEPAVGSGGG
jgi:phosphatidylglycerophosphate synthase